MMTQIVSNASKDPLSDFIFCECSHYASKFTSFYSIFFLFFYMVSWSKSTGSIQEIQRTLADRSWGCQSSGDSPSPQATTQRTRHKGETFVGPQDRTRGQGRQVGVLPGPDKTDSRSEIRTERPGPIPDLTPEICSSESGPEIRIDLNRTIPNPKFPTKLLVLALRPYLTKNQLTRNRPELNHTRSKPKRPEMSLNPNLTQPEFNLTRTRTE